MAVFLRKTTDYVIFPENRLRIYIFFPCGSIIFGNKLHIFLLFAIFAPYFEKIDK